MSGPPDLLIVGASARAAAWSAVRAGWRPCAVDLFGDTDLRGLCPTATVDPERYPVGLEEAVAEFPGVPWLYTGALENHPRVVARLARGRSLWGNGAEVLEAARCPFRLQSALQERGLPFPESLPGQSGGIGSGTAPVDGKRWLCKPLAGAGGMGIGFWPVTPWSRGRYLQEYIEGEAHSAVYVAGTSEGTLLLGITRQLIGVAWCGGSEFRYCGSIGPAALSGEVVETAATIGEAVAERFGLRGLFGVDFVLREGVPYPVEVNPRYTASVEILERGQSLAALAYHAEVFLPPDTVNRPARSGLPGPEPGKVWGKAIVYARRDVAFPGSGPWSDPGTPFPLWADIPAGGTYIRAGHPVLTVFGFGADAESCLLDTKGRTAETERWLYRRE